VSKPCVSVVIPVFNEAETVVHVAEVVLMQECVAEVIIVDDCSTDGTWQALETFRKRNPSVRIFRHQVNQGKGAALRTGFAEATAPLVLIQDADLEYDPGEYETLIRPILADHADVVYGSRFNGAGAHRVLYYWHSVGNKFLTTLSNMATNLNLSDMETCYKVFRREIVQGIAIEEPRFGFEPEITAKIARLGVRVYEVPISYYGRTYAEGKKVNWRDGISALRCIFKYNFLQ
jgi:glycosyltransferase involved in cell wall biosynthesis